jgi:hypothetical protein
LNKSYKVIANVHDDRPCPHPRTNGIGEDVVDQRGIAITKSRYFFVTLKETMLQGSFEQSRSPRSLLNIY